MQGKSIVLYIKRLIDSGADGGGLHWGRGVFLMCEMQKLLFLRCLGLPGDGPGPPTSQLARASP